MNVDSKYEMKVPDRILVVGELLLLTVKILSEPRNNSHVKTFYSGQDQHVGMKAPPHELVLENSILTMNNFPPIRVQVLKSNFFCGNGI